MRIANYIHDSIVDGEGLRFTLFVQGCSHRCKGCHNPQTHDPNGGREVTEQEIIAEMLSNPLLDGLTLSGGEPFDQDSSCAIIAKAAKDAGLNVWAYTGYTLEQLQERGSELLQYVDVLVDGPFMLDQRSLSLKWRGSHNQRIIKLT